LLGTVRVAATSAQAASRTAATSWVAASTTSRARVRKTPCEGRAIARYWVSIGQGPNMR